MPDKIDRLVRVNSLLLREIADYLEKYLAPPKGVLVSVTGVASSVDLRNASVGISIFGGTPAAQRAAFECVLELRDDIQRVIGKNLAFKHTPVLNFQRDNHIAQGDRVLAILEGRNPDEI